MGFAVGPCPVCCPCGGFEQSPTTSTALRQERAHYAANTRDRPVDLPFPVEVVLAVNHWTYAGRDTIAPRPTPPDGPFDDPEPSLAELEETSG